MDDLNTAVAGLFNDPGDNGTPTSDESTPENTDQTVESGTSDDTNGVTSQPANEPDNDTEEASLQQLIAQRKQEHPELADLVDNIYKELQGGYTKKFMDLSDQRKQFEGIDPSAVDQLRYYNQLQTPEQKALWLEYQAEIVRNGPQQQEQVDAYADVADQLPDWAVEKFRAYDQMYQQQELARVTNEVDRTFTTLQSEIGLDIPEADRTKVLEVIVSKNLAVDDIPMIWRSINYDKALQKGKQEGHKIRETKDSLPGAPTATTVRPAPASNSDEFVLENAARDLFR